MNRDFYIDEDENDDAEYYRKPVSRKMDKRRNASPEQFKILFVTLVAIGFIMWVILKGSGIVP